MKYVTMQGPAVLRVVFEVRGGAKVFEADALAHHLNRLLGQWQAVEVLSDATGSLGRSVLYSYAMPLREANVGLLLALCAGYRQGAEALQVQTIGAALWPLAEFVKLRQQGLTAVEIDGVGP